MNKKQSKVDDFSYFKEILKFIFFVPTKVMTALDFIAILLNFQTIEKIHKTWDKFRELKNTPHRTI